MRIKTYFVALVGAAATAAIITLLTVPIARTSGLEAATVSGAERVIGFTFATIAILLLVHTPTLVLVARTTRLHLARIWVSVGSAILTFLVFMLVPIIETGSFTPVVWNVQGWVARPAEFTADWLPFLAAAAVYGASAWTPKERGSASRQRVV
jgi:hypothetical protein